MSENPNPNPRTVADLARECQSAQNASNLRGLLRSYLSACDELASDHGVAVLTDHPIVRAWADKVASLCDVSDIGSPAAMSAHFRVADLAQ
jgi:hypothetical protein